MRRVILLVSLVIATDASAHDGAGQHRHGAIDTKPSAVVEQHHEDEPKHHEDEPQRAETERDNNEKKEANDE